LLLACDATPHDLIGIRAFDPLTRWNGFLIMVDTNPSAASALSNPSKPQISKVFWVGLATLVIGSGPLLTIISLAALGLTNDPNPNPVGFGILALLTFLPSIAIIVIGLILTLIRFNSARKQSSTNG